ncbi:hypothetical protein [Polyangium jinanense]|uniref:Uncharacterized protein n=1 Tax=Polyangium jinanense TaxID=2829994 RepID=A0A9X3X191_9BACT|nr:hypothetical protein [Polyangium jinanense]MDC3952839.1 hypothetical protein [Polyangium jinanense]MDC3980458.1 hypothetical protein [Polyangium jinanense]
MVMHIEVGKYQIKQNGKEVGKLAVVDGLQYYWLYLNVPAGSSTYAIYTAPSQRRLAADPGKRFASAPVVTFDFVYEGAVSSPFDVHEWKARSVPTSVVASSIVAIPPLSSIARSNAPAVNGQIDWGVFRLEQVEYTVGYVDVQSRSGGLPTESWFLYEAGGTHPAYRAPGTSGGQYTLRFVSGAASALDCVPTGVAYARHEFECSAVVITSM